MTWWMWLALALVWLGVIVLFRRWMDADVRREKTLTPEQRAKEYDGRQW